MMDKAFDYIRQNGLATESDYPYEGQQETCKQDASPAVKITGYERVPSNDESELLKAVANQPVTVAIDAGGQDFRLYSHGVFKGECGNRLNHAVTVVGYGTSEDGNKYWLIKNSWGNSWGEEGYMKLAREVGNTMGGLCGIAMEATYPTA